MSSPKPSPNPSQPPHKDDSGSTNLKEFGKLNYDNPPSIRYLPTTTAYDLWAEHYDHDSNFLQALDTREMKTLFPELMEQLSLSVSVPQPPNASAAAATAGQPTRRKIVDLGCGTGRNTVALLDVPDVDVVAVDASLKMLDVARGRIGEAVEARGRVGRGLEVTFQLVDLLALPNDADGLPERVREANAVVSTLVLEHIPCDVFFGCMARMLRPGGVALVTNMHSEMGGISQAGFVDPKTGEKIRPTSYAHTMEETVRAAKEVGFEVVGELRERSVDESLVEELGPRSRKWVGVMCWYGGLFRKVA